MAVLAEGRSDDKLDDEEECQQQEAQPIDGDLTITLIHEMLNTKLKKDHKEAKNENKDKGSRRLINAMALTAIVWELPKVREQHCLIRAKDHCKTKPAESTAKKNAAHENRRGLVQRTLENPIQ